MQAQQHPLGFISQCVSHLKTIAISSQPQMTVIHHGAGKAWASAQLNCMKPESKQCSPDMTPFILANSAKPPGSQTLQPLWWENPLALDSNAHPSASLQISRTDILRMSTALVATIGNHVDCGSRHSSHKPQACAHTQPSMADGINPDAPGPAHSQGDKISSLKAGGNGRGHCYAPTAGVAEHCDIDRIDTGRHEGAPSARATFGLPPAHGSSRECYDGSTNGEHSMGSTRFPDSSSCSSSSNKPRPHSHVDRPGCVTGSRVARAISQEEITEQEADEHANEATHAAEHPCSDHRPEAKAEQQQASGSRTPAASAMQGKESIRPCFRFAAGSQHSCSTHQQPPSTPRFEAPYSAAIGQGSLDERAQGRKVLADVLNNLPQTSASHQEAQGRPNGVRRGGRGSLPDTSSVSRLLYLSLNTGRHDDVL